MKKILPIIIAIIIMTQTVAADNMEDVISAWKTIYSGIKGAAYEEKSSVRIDNKEEWLNAIKKANLNLENSITLNIRNFKAEEYELSQLKSYDVSTTAKGNVNEDRARITYSFEYNPNYKMLRVLANEKLYSKLDLEEKQVYSAVKQTTEDIIKDCKTEYDRELAIHNFITDSYKYGPAGTNVPRRAHTITGIVMDKEGICEAYANLFYMMCRLAKLDVQFVTGSANGIGHMWVMIKLDGDYYHVDVTSDDPAPDVPYRERYDYFNVTDEDIARTHTWEREDYPRCTADKYNYHIYNDYVVSTREELEKFINENLNAGKTAFTFRTRNFIINSAEEIKKLTTNRGFYSIAVTGEYGKESTYNVTLK